MLKKNKFLNKKPKIFKNVFKCFLSLFLTFLILTNNIIADNKNENNENSCTPPKTANALDVNINIPTYGGMFTWHNLTTSSTSSYAHLYEITINGSNFHLKRSHIDTTYWIYDSNVFGESDHDIQSNGIILTERNSAIIVRNSGNTKNTHPVRISLRSFQNTGVHLSSHIAINPNCNVVVEVSENTNLGCQKGYWNSDSYIYTEGNRPAIFVHPNSELTLYSLNSSALNIASAYSCAGIGGANSDGNKTFCNYQGTVNGSDRWYSTSSVVNLTKNFGTINIGGNVILNMTHYEDSGQSSIGGGKEGGTGTINIGGDAQVNISGNSYGAAIGSGESSSGGQSTNINIAGNAKININKNRPGAGIGTGASNSSNTSNIKIGGNAKVSINKASDANGAAIGNGNSGTGVSSIRISDNAFIIARSGSDAAAIGGSSNSANCNITIEGCAFVVARGGTNGSCQDIGKGNNSNTTGSTIIKGGSVFCYNNRMSSPTPTDNAGNTVYPFYIEKKIGDFDLAFSTVAVPLIGGEFYRFAIRSDAWTQYSETALPNILADVIWLPAGSYSNFEFSSGVSVAYDFYGRLEANNASYSSYGTDRSHNWLKKALAFHVEDTPWYKEKTPTINGSGNPGFSVTIHKDSPTGTIIGTNTLVTSAHTWMFTTPPIEPDSQNVIFVEQKDLDGDTTSIIQRNLNVDTTPPTGKIEIGENAFQNFLNIITFGIFKTDTVTLKISATDNLSGVKEILYHKTNTPINDISEVSSLTWINVGELDGENSVTLTFDRDSLPPDQFNETFFIYAKIVDNASNVFYLNTDSIVIYTDSEADDTNVSYLKGNQEVTAKIKLNGNTVKSVKITSADRHPLTGEGSSEGSSDGTGDPDNRFVGYVLKDGDYSVENGVITFSQDFLDNLDESQYTLTIYYNPASIQTENYEAATTNLILTIRDSKLVIDPLEDWYTTSTPTITGEGEPSHNISVVDSESGSVIGETRSSEDGKFSITLNSLEDGKRVINIRQRGDIGKNYVRTSRNLNIDTTSPEGKIEIGENSFNSFLNTITFGLFFSNDQTMLTFKANDDTSGVAKCEYCITEKAVTNIEDASNLPYQTIENFNGSFTMPFNKESLPFPPSELNKSFFVYLKLTDNASNVSYTSSDSLTVFTSSEAKTERIIYTKGTYKDASSEVILNGNTVKGVKNLKTDKLLKEDDDYSISENVITLKSGYLESLDAQDYDMEVSYNPTANEKGESDSTTKFILTVRDRIIVVVKKIDEAEEDYKVSKDKILYSFNEEKREKIKDIDVFNVYLAYANGNKVKRGDVNAKDFSFILDFDKPSEEEKDFDHYKYMNVYDLNNYDFEGDAIVNDPLKIKGKCRDVDDKYGLVRRS